MLFPIYMNVVEFDSTFQNFNLFQQIRRQSTAELKKFKERWNQAAREDDEWTDPFDDFARENV